MDPDAPHIRPGEELRGRWEVKDRLGRGGFGQIFIAFDKKRNEDVAIKTEAKSPRKPTGELDPDFVEVLSLEQTVLSRLAGKAHFCEMIGCGADPSYNFLVMTLCGANLTDLRHDSPRQYFSFGTAAQVTIQSVEALESLHNVGYLHRDIKPSNLAVGRNSSSRMIYLVDFGLARKYIKEEFDENGKMTGWKLRRVRDRVGFRGTVRYASLTIHRNEEMGRMDDLWSVFYMFIEMAVGRLPWREETDKKKVKEFKERIDPSELISEMPDSIGEMVDYLLTLRYEDTPIYSYVSDRLRNAMRKLGIPSDETFDWDNMYRKCEGACPYQSPGGIPSKN